MTSSNERLDRIEALVETLVLVVSANSADIAATNEAMASTQASVDGLVQTIAESSTRSEERLNMLDDAIADISKSIVGINATNKNLLRILAQLIRHNRDSSGGKPQP